MLRSGAIQPFLPLVFFCANVCLQLLSNRLVIRLGVLKSELLGFSAGLAGILLVELYLYRAGGIPIVDLVGLTAANIVIYSALAYCYFHFVNLAITARRIRLLRDIYLSGDGLTMDEILAQYSAKDMIDNRIGRLLGSGQIALRGGRFFIGKPIVLLIDKIIVALKLFIIGKKSEFD